MFQAGQEFTVLGQVHGKVMRINGDEVIVQYEGRFGDHQYSLSQKELREAIALKEGTFLVIPSQFRNSEWCQECHMPTNGACGHFLDARDFYGPFERINWMDGSFPREAYGQWVSEHFQEIRYVQENPHFMDGYPDGSSGTIPYLAALAEKLASSTKQP